MTPGSTLVKQRPGRTAGVCPDGSGSRAVKYRFISSKTHRIPQDKDNLMNERDPEEIIILAVDDAPTNLSVLVDNLSNERCRVLTAESAKSAFNRLDHVIPDLILLDVMMPEMDGFTLCRKLKSHPIFKEIPVIFLTAKSDGEDIVEGFQAGGVDYVTKPFRKAELSMRIQTHLDLKLAKKKIRDYAYTLEDRNRRLSEMLDEKNEFIGVATHDLKNPLSVLTLALDLFRIKTKDKPIKEVESLMEQMDKTLKRMTGLVSQLLEINRLDVGRFELNQVPTVVEPIVSDMVQQNRITAANKRIEIDYEVTLDPATRLRVDPTAFSQILDNLLSNAVKYSPSGTRIQCTLEEVGTGEGLPDLILIDRKVRFVVVDEGPGIEPEEYPKVFQKFARTSNQPTGGESASGLGLSIAKRLVREMQGDIGFVSAPGLGSTFYLELPVRREL
jgi:two-component system, sensor histidine kinase and response regulator